VFFKEFTSRSKGVIHQNVLFQHSIRLLWNHLTIVIVHIILNLNTVNHEIFTSILFLAIFTNSGEIANLNSAKTSTLYSSYDCHLGFGSGSSKMATMAAILDLVSVD
jgi:hypothetical protein